MEDIINPYANPFLPRFANQRPVINNQPINVPSPQMNYSGINFGQIQSVKGFDGARNWVNSLSNGSSAILAEEDPNLSRVYIVAKDTNGQIYIKGGSFVPIEEPKPVTMDDLSSTMNKILDRLDKLEAEKNDKPVHGNSWNNAKQSGVSGNQPSGRNVSGDQESTK